MATKIGEVETEITAEVNKMQDLKAIIRINQGAEATGKIEFKPSGNLKKGDKVKITIEKI